MSVCSFCCFGTHSSAGSTAEGLRPGECIIRPLLRDVLRYRRFSRCVVGFTPRSGHLLVFKLVRRPCRLVSSQGHPVSLFQGCLPTSLQCQSWTSKSDEDWLPSYVFPPMICKSSLLKSSITIKKYLNMCKPKVLRYLGWRSLKIFFNNVLQLQVRSLCTPSLYYVAF